MNPQSKATTVQHKTSASVRQRMAQRPREPGWKQTLYDVIFEADTPAGRWFDIGLLIAILVSITVVSLETVPSYERRYGAFFVATEWMLTFLFTVEYVLRLTCVRRPLRYAFSFWGAIDLLSILPSYVTVLVGPSSRSFVILRSIRLLRVFRVLKLWRMMSEAEELGAAIFRARNKIIVFLTVVLVAVTISGTLMYHIEAIQAGNNRSQFTSIPQAMYWAIVTMTTVGYGDVVPQTSVGKVISAILILLGYSLIIVPSTFVSSQFAQYRRDLEESVCAACGAHEQHRDAIFCYRCGEKVVDSS